MCNSRVDVAVAPQQSVLNGLADLIGLGLPGTQTNSRDFGTCVEGVGLPIRDECLLVFSSFSCMRGMRGMKEQALELSTSSTYWVWLDILRN